MKPKKNPNADLSHRSGLYFVLGLIIALILAYTALEWKTYDPDVAQFDPSEIEDMLMEEVPPLIPLKAPPPPTAVAPPVIEIAPDEAEVEETEVISTETDQEKEIIQVADVVVVEDPDEDLVVPFIAIEEVPIFPGCENAKDKRECFQRMLNAYIKKNLKYPQTAQELGIEGKVFVSFVIGPDGKVGAIQMRGPDRSLETEAKRLMEGLPTMIPGKQRQRPVKVPFSLPIVFRLQ